MVLFANLGSGYPADIFLSCNNDYFRETESAFQEGIQLSRVKSKRVQNIGDSRMTFVNELNQWIDQIRIIQLTNEIDSILSTVFEFMG